MATQGTVTRWAHDLRSDDPAVRDRAAQQIWGRYFPDLLEQARHHLNRRLRGRVDAEDVLQSMYNSFCLRQKRGDYDLANRDALWNLLVTITLRKARNQARDQSRKKRDVARERATQDDGKGGAARWTLEQLEAAEPSPEEAAILSEALERRLEALADLELRQIAVWKLEGLTDAEIADRLEPPVSVRTVERKLKRIRDKMTSFDDGAL
jgi:RNA polymerase sigma factor (sigma-70 family)